MDLTNDFIDSSTDLRLYTCADGSGTLTTNQEDWYELKPPFTDVWNIVEGTGRYADLRGRGTYRGEQLSGVHEDPYSVVFRSVYTGMVDFDAVGPTITVASAKLTKLRRPVGTYSLWLRISMRDKDRGARLTYTVGVQPTSGELPYLVEKNGSTSAATVTVTVRFRPASGARTAVVDVDAEDPVGNVRRTSWRLKLPR